MKQPLTASERRGILAVAAIALLITGTGWLMSTCRRQQTSPSPPEIETLIEGDSLSSDDPSTASPGSKSSKKKRRRRDSISGSKTKPIKTYRRRSPRDEEV